MRSKEQDLPRSTVRISVADMMALRVRTGESESLPRLLYQSLPESDGMALMTTVPCGTPAISIPQQNGKHPFSRTPPEEDGGVLIVYARMPNNRYEAIEVLYRGQSFALAQFIKFAGSWLQKKVGSLTALPARFAYFAPTRDQLGVVLRDGGYAAVDPSAQPLDITAELLGSRNDPSTSGVIARVPVESGSSTPGKLLCTFARVELNSDAQPNPESGWISFVEFQRTRALKSRPPSLIIPSLRDWMARLARESRFESWSFRHGMFCSDSIEWWGHRNRRRTLHEGLDFCEGFVPGAGVRSIPEGTPVDALLEGEVVAVLDDYLNQTVIVRHQSIQNESGAAFHTLYSHISPSTRKVGPIRNGQLLGTVEKLKKAGAPAHLHVTGAWIPKSIPPEEITMDIIHPGFMPIVLTNFNSLVQSGGSTGGTRR